MFDLANGFTIWYSVYLIKLVQRYFPRKNGTDIKSIYKINVFNKKNLKPQQKYNISVTFNYDIFFI